MISKKIIILSILIFSFVFVACSPGINNDFFVELNNPEDYDVLINTMSEYDLILLGESTHGTQEFYEIRSAISKRLIKDHGFNFIVVEGDWFALYELNLYVKGLSHHNSARDVLREFDRWPEWMWSNKTIEELAEWLKDHNKNLSIEKRVGFYGKDVYGAEKSLQAVQKLTGLEYNCMNNFVNDFSLYTQYLHQGNAPCDSEVKEIYESIKSNRVLKNTLNDKDFFYIKQNAFVVKNAEKHYRAMIFPELDSWNVRVLHMNNTLNNLIEEKGDKAILWAHNTHVGDARFTAMSQSNNFNIGQLSRESNKNVFILGFGTYTGKVIAGRAWGQNKEIMNIPAANQNSYEYILENKKIDNALIFFDNPNLPEELKLINNNRAIGVVYNPKTEYPGNYVPTDISKRYDAYIFIKNTTALELMN